MKYQSWKIKTEHHIMQEFIPFLDWLQKIQQVKRIIPGRISRQQKWTWDQNISFSYMTTSGFKIKVKKWSTAQEIFIICDENDKEILKDIMLEFINK